MLYNMPVASGVMGSGSVSKKITILSLVRCFPVCLSMYCYVHVVKVSSILLGNLYNRG